MQPRFKLNHLCLALLAASPSTLLAAIGQQAGDAQSQAIELHET